MRFISPRGVIWEGRFVRRPPSRAPPSELTNGEGRSRWRGTWVGGGVAAQVTRRGDGPAFGGVSPTTGRGRAWPGLVWRPSAKRRGEAATQEGNGPGPDGLRQGEKREEEKKK